MSRLPRLRVLLLAGVSSIMVNACAAHQPQADYDPIEGFNRKVFWVNDGLDTYALAPVATGWDWVFPDAVQRAIGRFYGNLRFPVVAINNLLQGKFRASASDLGRFVMNTTAGALGFLDPATEFGLPQHVEDFGQTLGWWGVGAGPYLMLPFYGPSNPRDLVGRVVDIPLAVLPFFIDRFTSLGLTGVDLINGRSLVLEEVKNAKEASLDYYVFVRNAYVQRRQTLVNDSPEVTTDDEDQLYYPSDEEPAAPSDGKQLQ